MTIYLEPALNLEFLLSEGNGQISRDSVTVGGGVLLAPGSVLGQITASGVYVLSTVAAADGSQVAKAILGYRFDGTTGNGAAMVISRLAEVSAAALTYDASVNTPALVAAKAAQLAASLILTR